MKKILSRGISLLSFLFMVAFISIISVKAADVDEVSVHIINPSYEYITIYDSSESEVTSFSGYDTTVNLKIGETYKAVYNNWCFSEPRTSSFTPSLEETEWETGFYYEPCSSSPSYFTFSLQLKKVWEDNNNFALKRPESIDIEVSCSVRDMYYTSETKEFLITLNEENNWTNTIGVDSSESPSCTIKEKTILEDYEVSYSQSYVYMNTNMYTYESVITNTYIGPTIENTEIEIQKIWEDENNKKDIRPESVTFLLKANDSVIQEIELSDENEWKVVISVPKTDEEGNDIEYSIDEKEVPDGYEKKIDGFTITNKLIEEPLEEEKEPEEPVNPPANPNTGDSISKGSILFIGSLGILSYLLNRKKLSLK